MDTASCGGARRTSGSTGSRGAARALPRQHERARAAARLVGAAPSALAGGAAAQQEAGEAPATREGWGRRARRAGAARRAARARRRFGRASTTS